jgi:hypothetical protein
MTEMFECPKNLPSNLVLSLSVSMLNFAIMKTIFKVKEELLAVKKLQKCIELKNSELTNKLLDYQNI